MLVSTHRILESNKRCSWASKCRGGGAVQKVEGGGGGLGVGMNGGVGVFDKEYQSAPVNCKADRLSAFCTSRAKMSAIRTRHDKTTLLVTKGDNGHFRTLRAITYEEILNKSNAILAACLHLLASFGLECQAFACKKNTIRKKVGGGASAPLPLPVRRLWSDTPWIVYELAFVHHNQDKASRLVFTANRKERLH